MGEKENTRFCKYCGEDKPHIYTGKRNAMGAKIYVDENGKRWDAAKCPSCHHAQMRKVYHRRKRAGGNVSKNRAHNDMSIQ